jgi:hypothetical protein
VGKYRDFKLRRLTCRSDATRADHPCTHMPYASLFWSFREKCFEGLSCVAYPMCVKEVRS